MTNIPPKPQRSDFTSSAEYSKAVKRWKYAHDPQMRAKKVAANLAYAEAHREDKRQHERARYAADPEVRASASARSIESRKRDPFAPEKRRAYQNTRYANDPEFRATLRARQKDWHADNLEERRAKLRAYHHANRDSLNAKHREYNKIYNKENKEKVSANYKKHYASDPSYYQVKSRLRQDGLLTATPKWLTKQQKKAISTIYREARRLTELTGVKHVVDHVHPLTGKNQAGEVISCGLHVPWNLQVVTEEHNLSKGCRHGLETLQ